MQTDAFVTPTGTTVPAITAEEMRTVDRIAVEECGLSLLQMMEHAGRNLASAVLQSAHNKKVTVLAGGGGNGGGGLACARHLAARGRLHAVVLDRQPDAFEGAAATQLRVLERMDARIKTDEATAVSEADVLVDALIGYGLTGPPRGAAADLIDALTGRDVPIVSLDVPSGVDATTGETPGVAIESDRTLTLALPKTGLAGESGKLFLGDLGIPATVYETAGIPYSHPFGDGFVIDLAVVD